METSYRINKIKILNYRSFKPDAKQFGNVKPINILIGPNSSGKSNFCNALRLLLKPDTGADFGGGHGKPTIDSEHDFFNPKKEIVLKCDFKDGGCAEKHFSFHSRSKTVKFCFKKILLTEPKRFFPFGPDRSWANWAKKEIKNGQRISIIENSRLRKKVENKINKLLELTGHKKRVELPSRTSRLNGKSLANYLRVDHNVPSSEIGLGIGMFIYMICLIEDTVNAHIFLIEEPENHMHPRLQKMFLDYLIEWSNEGKQFFITTHSPFLINFASQEVIDNKNMIGIFKFWKERGKGNKKYTKWEDSSGNLRSQREILQELGVKASDVLQPNGIIWVEGPSDVIYVRKWLKLYFDKFQKEKKLIKFTEGVHYQLMWYGGPNLAYHMDFLWDSLEAEEAENVVNLPDLNPNCIFLVDADDFYDKGKESQEKNVRTRLKKKLDKFSNAYFWMTDEDLPRVQVKGKDDGKLTIECYLPNSILKDYKPIDFEKHKGKVQFANKVCEKLDKKNFLEKKQLKNRLHNLYRCIKKWNK